MSVTEKGKTLEIHNSVIESVISQEGLKLQACSLSLIHSYKAIHSTIHCQLNFLPFI